MCDRETGGSQSASRTSIRPFFEGFLYTLPRIPSAFSLSSRAHSLVRGLPIGDSANR